MNEKSLGWNDVKQLQNYIQYECNVALSNLEDEVKFRKRINEKLTERYSKYKNHAEAYRKLLPKMRELSELLSGITGALS